MTTLKELTQNAHDRIEQSNYSKALMAGQLSSTAWNMFTYQKYVYTLAIEKRITLPESLRRADLLLEDTKRVYPVVLNATTDYVKWINKTSDELLDAHLYVNYLGDLYGGQMLKKLAPGPTTHLDFTQRTDSIEWVRNRLEGKHTDLGIEANHAFTLIEAIQDSVFDLVQ